MTARRRGGRAGADGFTLVELLVAITILALLSGLLFGGFRFGARAWERAESHVDYASEIQIVHTFLRRRIAEAAAVRMPETPSSSEEGRDVYFEGDGRHLSFVTVMPVHLQTGGFSILDLFVEPGAAGGELILRWRPFLFGEAPPPEHEGDERVLLEGVRKVDFTYFGGDDEGDAPPVWHNTWRERRQLPRLVRLRIEFTDGARAIWPELVAGPMVATSQRRQR